MTEACRTMARRIRTVVDWLYQNLDESLSYEPTESQSSQYYEALQHLDLICVTCFEDCHAGPHLYYPLHRSIGFDDWLRKLKQASSSLGINTKMRVL
jgi:hypothetical protein